MMPLSSMNENATKPRPSKAQLIIEFTALFILVPGVLALPITWLVKGFVLLVAIIFVLYTGWKQGLFDWKLFLPDRSLPRIVWLRWAIFAVVSTIVVWQFFPDSLFKVPSTKPGLFVLILFVYTFFSVLPQEWLYRCFYQNRYGELLPTGITGILLNGMIFAFAHLVFLNSLVLILTFIGGCLFFQTYRRTGSLYAVSIEHALYGLWLFTLGIGDMLAFPG